MQYHNHLAIEHIPERPIPRIFPVAFGYEEETGMQDSLTGKMQEPGYFVTNFESFIPEDIRGSGEFLANGFRVYPEGASNGEKTTLERATPECSTPRQLALYTRASELLLVGMTIRFLTEQSQATGDILEARIQRRVVDGHGSRKGAHDNFGMLKSSVENLLANRLAPSFTYHLATRSFVTGAGHVRHNALQYAQKINGLIEVDGYGFQGGMYRITEAEGTPRIEVRCNDVNISDWATHIRIGSAAMVLALNQTPLARQLNDHVPDIDRLEDAKRMNFIKLRNDGTITPTAAQVEAVDFQQRVAELLLNKLAAHVDYVPDEYVQLAHKLYIYCEDYRQVLAGNQTISLLAKRADWATKLLHVLNGIERDQQAGLSRTLNDKKSQASDMRYDNIQIKAAAGKLLKINFGTAYKLRNKNFFEDILPENEINEALATAPTTTRAHIRGKLVRKYHILSCDWNRATVASPGDSDHGIEVIFEDVTQTSLTPFTQTVLSDIKQIRH
ncbi:MAG: Pup--protein ligase [Candidatus Saccharimonadales bacterium]